MRLHKKTIAVSAAALTIIGGTAFAYLTEAGTGSGSATVQTASGSVLLALAPDATLGNAPTYTPATGSAGTFVSSTTGLEDIFKGNRSGTSPNFTYDGAATTRTVEVWAYNTGDTTRTVTLHTASWTDAAVANTSTTTTCGSLITPITTSNVTTYFTPASVTAVGPGKEIPIGSLTVTYSDQLNGAAIDTDGCVASGSTLTYDLT